LTQLALEGHKMNTSVTFHKNSLPPSLRFLDFFNTQDGGQAMLVEGLENLNLNKITCLRLGETYGRADPNGIPTLWDYCKSVWELDSLEMLDICSASSVTDLPWPQEISKLTALTSLNLCYLDNYVAADANISPLQNLRQFTLQCSSDIPDGLPAGIFDLPPLSNLRLHINGNFKITRPSIWQIEKLSIAITDLTDYDFSQPLPKQSCCKCLILNFYNDPDDRLPPLKSDELNLTLEKLLRFLAPLKSLQSIQFGCGSLSGRLTQANMGRLVEFARRRPAVDMNFSKYDSDGQDDIAYQRHLELMAFV
jgi:hypothetical protein